MRIFYFLLSILIFSFNVNASFEVSPVVSLGVGNNDFSRNSQYSLVQVNSFYYGLRAGWIKGPLVLGLELINGELEETKVLEGENLSRDKFKVSQSGPYLAFALLKYKLSYTHLLNTEWKSTKDSSEFQSHKGHSFSISGIFSSRINWEISYRNYTFSKFSDGQGSYNLPTTGLSEKQVEEVLFGLSFPFYFYGNQTVTTSEQE